MDEYEGMGYSSRLMVAVVPTILFFPWVWRREVFAEVDGRGGTNDSLSSIMIIVLGRLWSKYHVLESVHMRVHRFGKNTTNSPIDEVAFYTLKCLNSVFVFHPSFPSKFLTYVNMAPILLILKACYLVIMCYMARICGWGWNNDLGVYFSSNLEA